MVLVLPVPRSIVSPPAGMVALPVMASDVPADSVPPSWCTPVLAPPPLVMMRLPPAVTLAVVVTRPVVVAPVMVAVLAPSLMLPPVEMASLTAMLLPASRVSAFVCAVVKPLVTVRLFTACSNTGPLPSWVTTAPAVMRLSAVAKVPNSRLVAPRSSFSAGGVFADPATPSMSGPAPPLATVSTMFRFNGSSSSTPVLPNGADRSELPRKSSVPLPDTSTRPPSPPRAPPRAFAAPWKRVPPSAHTTTSPPSPAPVALASSSAPGCTTTCRALRSRALPPW